MEYLKQLLTQLSPPQPFAGETEQQFLLDYSEKHINRRKLLSVVGFSICLAYLLFDASRAFNDVQFMLVFSQKILPIRLVCLVFLIIFIRAIFRPAIIRNEHHVNICAAFGILSIYLTLLALTYAVPYPDEYFYYYDRMLLVLLALFGITKLLTKPVLVLIVILLFFSALTFNASDFNSIASAHAQKHSSPTVFLVIFCLMGYLMTLEQEHASRMAFLRETELNRAKEETNQNALALIALKEQSRLQAEQQNRDKSKFMANAAHDLRNVMQPVENFLDVSLSALSHGDAPQTQEYLKEAIIANKALCTAVNALLEISGLESGIINLRLSSFDLHALAAEVIQTSQSRVEQQKVKLMLSKHHEHAIVHSDRQHLKRVLTNLVINAIKYADTNNGKTATVAIAIIQHNHHIRLDVIDNGIGIPLSEQKNVFKPLHQLHNPERDRDKGIGLGLSIVDATLKLLTDHSIKLSSKPGHGTRFSLILPKGEVFKQDKPELLTHDLASDLSGLYVLLVENDLLVQRSMVALLQANHAQYEAVSTMTELHGLLPTLARYPDIVVTDYRLSDDCTAVDVISAIQAAFGKDLPTLILTGETADLSPILADRKILHKPVAAKQLLAEISQLAQGQQPPVSAPLSLNAR